MADVREAPGPGSGQLALPGPSEFSALRHFASLGLSFSAVTWVTPHPTFTFSTRFGRCWRPPVQGAPGSTRPRCTSQLPSLLLGAPAQPRCSRPARGPERPPAALAWRGPGAGDPPLRPADRLLAPLPLTLCHLSPRGPSCPLANTGQGSGGPDTLTGALGGTTAPTGGPGALRTGLPCPSVLPHLGTVPTAGAEGARPPRPSPPGPECGHLGTVMSPKAPGARVHGEVLAGVPATTRHVTASPPAFPQGLGAGTELGSAACLLRLRPCERGQRRKREHVSPSPSPSRALTFRKVAKGEMTSSCPNSPCG